MVQAEALIVDYRIWFTVALLYIKKIQFQCFVRSEATLNWLLISAIRRYIYKNQESMQTGRNSETKK